MRRAKAVALAYSDGEPAPRIVAKGRGPAAERILQRALDSGVTIVEERSLADLLEPLGVGAYVPEKCWEAVARVLAFVMAIEDGK